MISMHYLTLYVIDIHNIRCLEPFLPLYDHFEILRFLVRNWQYQLKPCSKKIVIDKDIGQGLQFLSLMPLHLTKSDPWQRKDPCKQRILQLFITQTEVLLAIGRPSKKVLKINDIAIKGEGSRVPFKPFCFKIIQNYSLTAKTCFAHSLSFILCIYSS